MNISVNNSFLLAAQASMFNTSHKNTAQAARNLAAQLQGSGNRYDMAAEARDLSQIWQRARDWGLGVQQDMAQEARTVAMRASNGAVYTDAQRRIMNMEVQSLAAETTRIGLTNNINGSHTLARYEDVQHVEETTEVVEGSEEIVTEVDPQIDVLWVVDVSGSMGDNISHLKNDAEQMFKAFTDKGYKVRMAVEGFEYDLDSNGSTDFRDNVTDFKADVNSVLQNIHGGIERGLHALDQAMDRFAGKMNQDATKFTVLITDEPSNDFSNWIQLSQNPGDDQYRQSVANKLISADSGLHLVGGGSGTLVNLDGSVIKGPDADYVDVVTKVGDGESLGLDKQGKWVEDITDKFIASVEADISEGKFDGVVRHREVTTTRELLDEWDMNFQLGPHSVEHTVERFKTSISETSGLANADLSTADKARESPSVIDGAIGFLGSNSVQVGSLQNQFSGINNSYAIKGMNQPLPATMPFNAFRSYMYSSLGGAF